MSTVCHGIVWVQSFGPLQKNNMKVLVTGGAGFIGSNFCHYWAEKHPTDILVNLDKLTYAGNLKNLEKISGHPNYSFIQGDICDKDLVNRVMKDVEIVVHFAAESHVDRSILDPYPFITTNIIGTQVLLDAALKCKVKRFHHISTDEVFGSLALGSKTMFNEESPYDPHSPYAATKAASDHLVRAYHTTYGLPVSISNCSNNFGPYQFPEKLVSLAITNILEGKKVPVYGDGLNVRDWLYVEDHVRAIDLILQRGTVGETYFVGGQTADVSNLEVVRMIVRLMGKDEDTILFVKDRPGHDRRYAVDWGKMRDEFGWKPEHDFESALKKTIDWYTNHTEWWQELKMKNADYYNKQYA